MTNSLIRNRTGRGMAEHLAAHLVCALARVAARELIQSNAAAGRHDPSFPANGNVKGTLTIHKTKGINHDNN